MTAPLALPERILRQLEDNLTAAHRERRSWEERWLLVHCAAMTLHGLGVATDA